MAPCPDPDRHLASVAFPIGKEREMHGYERLMDDPMGELLGDPETEVDGSEDSDEDEGEEENE